jgi:hypothetical protein
MFAQARLRFDFQAFDRGVAGILCDRGGADLIGQLDAVVTAVERSGVHDQLAVEPVGFESDLVGLALFGAEGLRRRSSRKRCG